MIDDPRPAIPDDFFERLPPPPPPTERVAAPPWVAPPRDEIAALVPDRRVLVRGSDGVVVLLSHIDVFSSGCRLVVRASVHHRQAMSEEAWWEVQDRFRRGGHPLTPHRRAAEDGGGLRFGVLFEDGTKATTGGLPWRATPMHDRPDGPVLRQSGGGGSSDDHAAETSWTLWLWPLPPAAPFDLVITWPEFGIGMDRVTIDGAAIVRAAEQVQPFVPE